MKVAELLETKERSILSVLGKQEAHYSGNFYCTQNNLTSLEGAPTEVGGSFSCGRNNLTSLEGAPTSVGGNFYCNDNKLTSLEGAPTDVGGDFHCYSNNLTSLEGAPTSVGGNFYCDNNRLASLKGIHKQIKHIGGQAYFTSNPIESHILGLLKIEGLESVAFSDPFLNKILNKHLKSDRDIFACQEELIEAGYPEFAQL